MWWCHQLLSGFLAKGHLPLALSVASVTSVANDKGGNEMILGVVHRSPGICLTAEENLDLLKPAVHGAMGCGQKSFKLVWRCHRLLSGFLAIGHLPLVSR